MKCNPNPTLFLQETKFLALPFGGWRSSIKQEPLDGLMELMHCCVSTSKQSEKALVTELNQHRGKECPKPFKVIDEKVI